MYIHTTVGVAQTNLIGDVPGYGTVWFHPGGIANILSLSKVTEQYTNAYDSSQGNIFIVHKPNGPPGTSWSQPMDFTTLTQAKPSPRTTYRTI